jgi:hypothetical protein
MTLEQEVLQYGDIETAKRLGIPAIIEMSDVELLAEQYDVSFDQVEAIMQKHGILMNG